MEKIKARHTKERDRARQNWKQIGTLTLLLLVEILLAVFCSAYYKIHNRVCDKLFEEANR